jgi:hypothetical protein
VCLTMCGDWVVCGVGLQAMSEATQSWAERFFLPALRTHDESAARDMVLATMPQVSHPHTTTPANSPFRPPLT